MSSAQSVSVVVVSQGRADLLCRCLAGLRTLFHRPFEVVVVADPEGLAALRAQGWLEKVKHRDFDRANISAARNAGIAMAAGDVVAFIDDDAVCEPTWLDRLVAPFADPAVAASGGFVLGRNGISWQWKARQVDGRGVTQDLSVPEDAVSLHGGRPGRAVKLEGTNCAFRAEVLRGLGGFDEAYHFYLDETDLCYRIAQAGHVTAIVPDAVVHHAFAASDRRTDARVPTTLADIGASSAVYLQRHAQSGTLPALARLRAEQRARLDRLVEQGRLGVEQRAQLMATLERGINEGMRRPRAPATFDAAPPAFLPFPARGKPQRTALLAGRAWQAFRLTARAEALAREGVLATVMLLSPDIRRHRVWFDPRGFWVQRGGLFGPSLRDQPAFRWSLFSARVAQERRRQEHLRPMGDEG